MPQYNNSVTVKFVTAANGTAGVGASVTVYQEGTETLASLTNALGDPIDNPTYTDDKGNYTFNASVGVYDIVINEGFLSTTSLMGEVIAASTGVDPTVPNTFTAPQTFEAPNVYNSPSDINVGQLYKDVNSAAYIFISNIDGYLTKAGSRLVDFTQVTNNNNSVSAETVPSSLGMDATITRRLLTDDWESTGKNTFSASTTSFNSQAILNNGAIFNSGGLSLFVGSAFQVASPLGIELQWIGDGSYSSLAANATGVLEWDGVEIVTTATGVSLSGVNTWTAPNTYTTPTTFDSPSQNNVGSYFKDANSAASLFMSNVDGYLQNGSDRIVDFTQVSNSNNSAALDTVPSNAGMDATITQRLFDENFGTAAQADLTTSLYDTTAGRALKVDDYGIGSYTLNPQSVTHVRWIGSCERGLSGFGVLFVIINLPEEPTSFTAGAFAYEIRERDTGTVVKSGGASDLALDVARSSRFTALFNITGGYAAMVAGQQYDFFTTSAGTTQFDILY
jgi:hypothetical protein